MGACISSSVEEQVQKPAEPAKKLDLGAVGFKTLAMSVEVVGGLVTGAVGVTGFVGIMGFTTVITVIWVPVYLIPSAIINTLVGGPFSAVIVYAERYWQDIVVETFVDFYEIFVNRTIGDSVRNVRDIWRMPVYR